MTFLNTNQRTVGPTKNDSFQPSGRTPTLYGVFLGFVKDASDVQRNGRLKVWIPEFNTAPENANGWIIVHYSSPFAGATNIETADANNVVTFQGTQTSYGMWMIPPDINNQVLVMFINGDPSRGVFIGSLYNQFMNNMIPAMAASTNNYQYPNQSVPVAEYNKYDQRVKNPAQATHPYEATKFRGIGNQGLLNDRNRGITNTSARREAPSQVFGILTPGPVIQETKSAANIRRKGGSSFIMDDGDNSEYIQLATKSGAQIKINETTGFIYLINRDGTAWVQLDQFGNVDVFGARHISMRAQYDVNIRADRNINIEAGQNVFIKAAKDTKQQTTTFTYDVNNNPNQAIIPVFAYKGAGLGDLGGSVVIEALADISATAAGSINATAGGSIGLGAGGSISSSAGGDNNMNGGSGIKIGTGGSIDMTAGDSIRETAGGSISLISGSDVSICATGSVSLSTVGDIISSAGGAFSINADSIASTPSLSTPSSVGGISAGSVTPPATLSPIAPQQAISPAGAGSSVTKPTNDKINILATWKTTETYQNWLANTTYSLGDIRIYNNIIYIAKTTVPALPAFDIKYWDIFIVEDKFKRNSETLKTILSRFPTYEPCPEHSDFTLSSITDYTPTLSEYDTTYVGSGAPGGGTTVPIDVTDTPAPTPGVPTAPATPPINPDADSANIAASGINLNALRCQLIIHEGRKTTSYLDSVGLLTGGIGHLMRSNEKPLYPAGTRIQDTQIESWYTSDSAAAIKIAQDMFSDIWDSLSGIRKRALADLAYNLGKGKLSAFVNFIASMNSKNFTKAGQDLHDSVWYGQVGRRGPNIITMITQSVDPNGCDIRFPG